MKTKTTAKNKLTVISREVLAPDYFRDKLKKVALLNGSTISDQRIEALYEELIRTNIEDFNKACDYMANHDIKITLANLRKHIDQFMEERLERLAEAAKKRELAEIRSLIASASNDERAECGGGTCGSCRVYEECKTLRKAFLRATIAALSVSKEERLNVFESYAKRFRGAGFEELYMPEPF